MKKITRRNFLQKSLIAGGALTFGSCLLAKDLSDFENYILVKKEILIENLPFDFENFTIGVLSDIHSSASMTKSEMQNYSVLMNSLKPDLIVVTGDFVNDNLEQVYPMVESFSDLSAKFGVYGCLGNHDFYTGKVDLVSKEIVDGGIKLLRNDFIKIEKGNSFINLIGVDDMGKRFSFDNLNVDKTISLVKNDAPKILLCHRPYEFEKFAMLGIDLTISGHTHGGQILIHETFNQLSLARIVSPFVAGLFKNGKSNLYVNTGIGTAYSTPRINCPPEVTLITLKKS